MADTTPSNGVKKTKNSIRKKTKPSKRDRHRRSKQQRGATNEATDVDLKRTLHELRKLAGAHHRAAKSVQSASVTLLERVGRLEQASDELETILSQIRPPPRKRNRSSKKAPKVPAVAAPIAEAVSEDTDSDDDDEDVVV